MLEAGIRQFTAWGNTDPGRHVLADNDPAFRRGNFCSVIRGSAWSEDGPRVKKNNRAGERDTLGGDAYARQLVR